jgi:hypothetical protein
VPSVGYTVLEGDGSAVGAEELRSAPGPVGWRAFSEVRLTVPEPHHEIVDLAVDTEWRPVRARISTGAHEVLLLLDHDRLTGFRDGDPIVVAFGSGVHLDHRSPMFDAVTANRLTGPVELEVVVLEGATLEPTIETRRYEPLGDDEIATPAGRFAVRGWRCTAPSTGRSRDFWVADDVAVRSEGRYELTWYEAGASGPRPVG